MQLKAGYFSNGIEALKSSESMAYMVDALMESLSYFDLDTNIGLADTCDDPAVALMYNIVSRGTPAYASQFVEDILSTTIGKTLKRVSDSGDIYRDIQKDEVKSMAFKALHVIDPRVRPEMPKSINAKTQEIYRFVMEGAVPSQGDFIYQLADTQCCFENLFKFSKKLIRQLDMLKADPAYEFLSQKCDLLFSAPYSSGGTADAVAFQFSQDRNGVDTTDYITEEKISDLLKSINVQGRVIVRDSDSPADRVEDLSGFASSQYFDILRQNYQNPLYATEDGLEALQIALTPLAIARVQKVVLEAVNSGTLSLQAKKWSICVIERDVPCAFLALEDLKQHFSRFFTLESQGRKFPQVKLEIFHTPEFENTELNLLYQGSRSDISEFNPLRRYDLLIDISVLRRAGADPEVPPTVTDRYAIIRSSKSPSADTRLLFSNYIHYDIQAPPQEGNNGSDYDDDDEEEEESDSDSDSYTEQEDAMRFFLKNIFAKSDFLPGQIGTIRELLNGSNVLHISGPSTGKTLAMLYAAFMKPGYSLILPPTIAVMESQFMELRARRIDCCYYISPVLQNSRSRRMAVKDVLEGKSIITFVSPSLVHDPYIRGVFRQIDQRNIPIFYVMLDEAQRISLQTTEYRAYYQDIKNIIASNFSSENVQSLRIGAFTSTMEANIQKEIAEKLKTDITMLCADSFGPLTSAPITIHEVEPSSGDTPLEAKQHRAEALIEGAMSKSPDAKAMVLGSAAPFNQVDIYGEGVQICGIDTAHYQGDIDEAGMQISSSAAYRSMKELTRFCSSSGTRILAAAYSAGLGVHAPGLRRIIHIEPPLSLDQFCRANGRGDQGGSVSVDVLINTAPSEYEGVENVRDMEGRLTQVQNVVATNYDTAANLQRLSAMNPGAIKEKAVIGGLLDGIVFPVRMDRNNIIDAVFNEFGIEIDTDTEPMARPYQLYIYSRGRSKSYGHIDFRQRRFHLPEMQYDQPLAEKLQSYIYDIIADNTEDPLAYLATMETEFEAEENDGIQTALDAIEENQKAKVLIPFYNSAFSDAASLLSKCLGQEVKFSDIQRCYNKTQDFGGFCQAISLDCGISFEKIEEENSQRLHDIYSRFRNKKDTLLAVSRLKEIEVIDDYLVNAATGIVTVSLTKHSKDFYRMKLMPILQRNLTRERMLAYISSIEEKKYLSIEKYTDVLIDFFYSEIYPLYEKSAMEASKFFDTMLAKQKDGTISAKQVSDNLNCYFKQRYKCRFVFDSSDALDGEAPQNVDKIVGIISRAGSNINQLLNLQQSIDLSAPENRTPANKIIYGYCSLFTSADSSAKARFDAYSQISDGLLEYRRKHTISEFNNELEAISAKIADENYDLKDESSEVIALQMQRQWLKWFNEQVLKVNA